MTRFRSNHLEAVSTALFVAALCGASTGVLAEDAPAKDAAASATKFEVSPTIKRIQRFGDLRLRYESRAASSTFPIADVDGAGEEQPERWR